MPPTKKYLSVGGRASPVAPPIPVASPEPCAVIQAATSAPACSNAGMTVNAVFADLNYSFNRHEAQVRSYSAKRDEELDEAGDD